MERDIGARKGKNYAPSIFPFPASTALSNSELRLNRTPRPVCRSGSIRSGFCCATSRNRSVTSASRELTHQADRHGDVDFIRTRPAVYWPRHSWSWTNSAITTPSKIWGSTNTGVSIITKEVFIVGVVLYPAVQRPAGLPLQPCIGQTHGKSHQGLQVTRLQLQTPANRPRETRLFAGGN
ncbi:hypothetical protein JZ751_027357 [Albula glossodonta]|uniref:Uncharacterized protein n=1 Tax=Albula glossodonta TaxID=121402 RepID=A0A8T2MX66_9TELE|nr:hypothetical protein JZ751_027357 [Albula glossodonta]